MSVFSCWTWVLEWGGCAKRAVVTFRTHSCRVDASFKTVETCRTLDTRDSAWGWLSISMVRVSSCGAFVSVRVSCS